MSVNPTESRIRLSRTLRTVREAAGVTQRDVAMHLDWSISKINRIETGQVGVAPTDVRALLDYYRVDDQHRVDELVELARQGRKHSWTAYRDVLNPEYRVYLGYEGIAARLWQFEPLVVPGILQTESYARAVIESVAPPGDDENVIARQLAVRRARWQALERSDPPTSHFILDEGVLLRQVGVPGSAAVLREQLEQLKAISKSPSVSIQILPFTHGSHVGLMGSFVVLEFDLPDESGLVYLDHGRPNGVVRDRPDLVALYRGVFDRLADGASAAGELDTVIDRALARLDDRDGR